MRRSGPRSCSAQERFTMPCGQSVAVRAAVLAACHVWQGCSSRSCVSLPVRARFTVLRAGTSSSSRAAHRGPHALDARHANTAFPCRGRWSGCLPCTHVQPPPRAATCASRTRSVGKGRSRGFSQRRGLFRLTRKVSSREQGTAGLPRSPRFLPPRGVRSLRIRGLHAPRGPPHRAPRRASRIATRVRFNKGKPSKSSPRFSREEYVDELRLLEGDDDADVTFTTDPLRSATPVSATIVRDASGRAEMVYDVELPAIDMGLVSAREHRAHPCRRGAVVPEASRRLPRVEPGDVLVRCTATVFATAVEDGTRTRATPAHEAGGGEASPNWVFHGGFARMLERFRRSPPLLRREDWVGGRGRDSASRPRRALRHAAGRRSVHRHRRRPGRDARILIRSMLAITASSGALGLAQSPLPGAAVLMRLGPRGARADGRRRRRSPSFRDRSASA